jgi:hypothetical protein
LEKAATIRNENSDQIANGVHISFWRDVASNIRKSPIATANGDEIVSSSAQSADQLIAGGAVLTSSLFAEWSSPAATDAETAVVDAVPLMADAPLENDSEI